MLRFELRTTRVPGTPSMSMSTVYCVLFKGGIRIITHVVCCMLYVVVVVVVNCCCGSGRDKLRLRVGVMHEKKNFFDINFDWLKFGI